jgi:hypothetical protein
VTPDDLVSPEVWADEGRRTAPLLTEIAAAVVVGRDATAAAAVALGLARACAGAGLSERRVAVADLVGGVPLLTPLDDQLGLLECLRDGTPVSTIGQPLADAPNVYLLPAGRGPIAERWVFESARWDRLVGGFREVDALLLLVAQAGAPGLERLIERVDGVVAVDLPPAVLRSYPLIATIDHPEPELPAITRSLASGAPAVGTAAEGASAVGASALGTPSAPRVPAPRKQRKLGRWIGLGIALGATLYAGRERLLPRPAVPLAAHSAADSAAAVQPAPVPPPDTALGARPSSDFASDFALGPVVNPEDSATALRFSVELVAANSLSGANSGLTSRGNPHPIPTVAPVLLGPAPTVWYRAMVGAWSTKAEAEVWLERVRALGLVRNGVGRVVYAPLALQLFEGPREEALVQTAQLDREDVRVYVLETTDGRVRVMAGAFETASQALWFAAQLHGRGLSPQLAYRTGRTF